MKIKTLLLLPVLLFAIIGPLNAQTRTLVWSDEFNNNGLPDSTKWNYNTGGHGWGNQEAQFYTVKRLENARCENGNLIIEARKEEFQGKNYTSARLTTKGKGDWLYGRIEVSAKIPQGVGMWPAIWMLSTENTYGGWPRSGEIDIMEYVGYEPHVIHGTIHTEAYNHSKGTQKGTKTEVADAETSFHVYVLEWDADVIKIYVDETLYFTYNRVDNDNTKWPFNKPFHLILNTAVGGTWGGAKGIDDTIFPQKFEIDYVRVYQSNDVEMPIRGDR